MDELTTFQVLFNLHQVPAAMGLDVPLSAAAAILGVPEDEVQALVGEIRRQVEAEAERLASRPALAAALRNLSLPPGGRLLAAGDSITAYRHSYAELLRALFGLLRPGDGLSLLNAGQSGYTSTQVLETTYGQLLALDPDLVLLMIGVNDGKQFGGPGSRPLVSPREYEDNLSLMAEAWLARSRARLVLLTPTPVVVERIEVQPDFCQVGMRWQTADLEARAGIVRRLAAARGLPCVDLWRAFGPAPDPGLYLADGLHPNPAGQRLILETVLHTLAEPR